MYNHEQEAKTSNYNYNNNGLSASIDFEYLHNYSIEADYGISSKPSYSGSLLGDYSSLFCFDNQAGLRGNDFFRDSDSTPDNELRDMKMEQKNLLEQQQHHNHQQQQQQQQQQLQVQMQASMTITKASCAAKNADNSAKRACENEKLQTTDDCTYGVQQAQGAQHTQRHHEQLSSQFPGAQIVACGDNLDFGSYEEICAGLNNQDNVHEPVQLLPALPPLDQGEQPYEQQQQQQQQQQEVEEPARNKSQQTSQKSSRSRSRTPLKEKKPREKRQKDRLIEYAIDMVNKWKELCKRRGEFKTNKTLSQAEAAEVVGLSVKTLDDYERKIKQADQFGFNFNDPTKKYMGDLRKFVKEEIAKRKLNQESY